MVNITTGGAPWMTVEERVRPAATFVPEVSLNSKRPLKPTLRVS